MDKTTESYVNEIHDLNDTIDGLISENTEIIRRLHDKEDELDKYKEIVEQMRQFFRSGNNVPVEAARIPKKSFENIIERTIHGDKNV